MPITIYDIARQAKVGIGTVSRVFNDHPSVSEETRERVLRIAKKLSYRPHPYARGLARNRTDSIMAIIPFFTTFFFMEILQGVQSRLSEMKSDLILYGVNHPDQVEESLQHHALRNRVDGMLFFSMRLPESFIDQAQESKTPLVLVDAFHKRLDSLSVDNRQGAYVATRHLITQGYKRIGMLNANPGSLPARERLYGFKKALKDSGIAFNAAHVKHSNSERLDGFTRESGYDLMKEFLSQGRNMPAAIFVSSDIQASGALAALADAGVRCPEDVALVGFDDIEISSHLGLTTMRQPMFEMGVLASELLAERQRNPGADVTHSMFLPKLVVRKSCGAQLRGTGPAGLHS